jgi:Zn-dependent M28 family amino/carboxypeptidase
MRRVIGSVAILGVMLLALAWIEAAPQQTKANNNRKSAATTASYGNADAITAEELKEYEYYLASDELEGRYQPSRGYNAAAKYIAGHLHQWGLKPGGSTAGTDGPLEPYLMPIELVSNQLNAEGMKLSLNMPPPPAGGGRGRAGGATAVPAGPRSFEFAREWTIGGGGFGGGRGGGTASPANIVDAQMVFVGNGYVINKTNTNPYEGINVRGKVLVVAGVPPELAQAQLAAAAAASGGGQAGAAAGGQGRGGAGANPLGKEDTDYMTPQGYASKNGALGIIMVPTLQQLTAMANPNPAGGGRGAGPNGPAYQVVKFQDARPASVPSITAGLELTTAIFQREKLTAAQVLEGIVARTRLASFELNAEKKLSLTVSVTSDRSYAYNVIGMLEGSDPVLKNEYVVMTAHLDHVGLAAPGSNSDVVFNGADDDASGCAGVMAMARAYAEGAAKGISPKRTMIFLWVAGEERNLWGSQYFNQFPPVDITKVVLNLNMDMIGRHKTPGYVDPPQYKLVEPNEIFVVGPDISSDDVGKTLEALNNNYQKLSLNHFYDVTAPDATHDNLGPAPNGQRIFYRSDHYNFAKMGIPVIFFTSGLHSDYHRVTDSADKLDYQQMQAVSRTLAALAWVVGNRAAPPKLNDKLPERLMNDMKTVKEQGWGKLTPVPPPEKRF